MDAECLLYTLHFCFLIGRIFLACRVFILIGTRRMPGESLFIELYDYLWTTNIGLFSGHQISFIATLPLHKEHKLSRGVCGAQNFGWFKTTIETYSFSVVFFLLSQSPFWLGFSNWDGRSAFLRFLCKEEKKIYVIYVTLINPNRE